MAIMGNGGLPQLTRVRWMCGQITLQWPPTRGIGDRIMWSVKTHAEQLMQQSNNEKHLLSSACCQTYVIDLVLSNLCCRTYVIELIL